MDPLGRKRGSKIVESEKLKDESKGNMKINHVTILVKNRQKALEFYSGVLGLKKKNVKGHVWLEVGNSYLHLTENSGQPVSDTFYHFAISTDLDNVRKKLVSRNVEFQDKSSQIFLRDPNGNLVEFVDENDLFFK